MFFELHVLWWHNGKDLGVICISFALRASTPTTISTMTMKKSMMRMMVRILWILWRMGRTVIAIHLEDKHTDHHLDNDIQEE